MRQLLLNGSFLIGLIQEAIGILVTVFFVNWMIARRERKRSLPARRVLWADLTDLTNDLTSQILPQEYSTDSHKNLLQFGDTDGYVFRELRAGELNRITSGLEQKLEKEYERMGDDAYEYEAILPIPANDKLRSVRDKIDALIARYSAFLDPEPANHLLQIRNHIADALMVHEAKSALMYFAGPMNNIAVQTKELHGWLRDQADKELTINERFQQINDKKAEREKTK
ncbi:MAG: hypothetical protein H7Z16_19235 [Pyrinomonadaceae bacterium]|nr:hypothetical protein [Pyrinomonadaceae bacterium]